MNYMLKISSMAMCIVAVFVLWLFAYYLGNGYGTVGRTVIAAIWALLVYILIRCFLWLRSLPNID